MPKGLMTSVALTLIYALFSAFAVDSFGKSPVRGADSVASQGSWSRFLTGLLARREANCWHGFGEKAKQQCCDQKLGPRGRLSCWSDYVDFKASWDSFLHSYELCCTPGPFRDLRSGFDDAQVHETSRTQTWQRQLAVVIYCDDSPAARRFWPLALLGVSRNFPLKQLGARLYFITEGKWPGLDSLAQQLGLDAEVFHWLKVPRQDSWKNYVSGLVEALMMIEERWVFFMQEDVLIPAPVDVVTLQWMLDFAVNADAAVIHLERGRACDNWLDVSSSTPGPGNLQLVEANLSTPLQKHWQWFFDSGNGDILDRSFFISMLMLFPGKQQTNWSSGSSLSESHANARLGAMAAQRRGSPAWGKPPRIRIFAAEYVDGLGGKLSDGGVPLALEQRFCPCSSQQWCAASGWLNYRCVHSQFPMDGFGCQKEPKTQVSTHGLDQIVVSAATGGFLFPWFEAAANRVKALVTNKPFGGSDGLERSAIAGSALRQLDDLWAIVGLDSDLPVLSKTSHNKIAVMRTHPA
mmetsp:Transcript_34330/g.55201  ORF Transcript_34330/g.55201 Transcript_34330/m.55201 type:complete len:521 (-) Transcript_34330:85-1647(-)